MWLLSGGTNLDDIPAVVFIIGAAMEHQSCEDKETTIKGLVMQEFNTENDTTTTTTNKKMYVGIMWLSSEGGNLDDIPPVVFVIGPAMDGAAIM